MFPLFSGKMSSTFSKNLTAITPLLLLLLATVAFSNCAETRPDNKPDKAPENSVSAILVFGDSTSDPGNNNYIMTPFKSNFSPYGRDFPNRVATGRFTNGKLVSDFIAMYVGVKELVPPYLNSSLTVEELMTGVSFASAGCGYDPLTPRLSGVIPMSKQMEYFKEYITRIEASIGKQKAKEFINKAFFIVSAGTNDFVVNYYTFPFRKRIYNVPQYHHFLMQTVHQFLRSLLEQGARKIAVIGLPPIGCLPIVITMNSSNPIHPRECVDTLSAVAREYNQLLQNELNSIQLGSLDRGTKIVYIDVYSPLANMVQGPGKSYYGFEVVSSGCCGTGYIEASFMCNRASYVCLDPTKYVFWDSIHPTEKAYYLIFESLRPVIDYIIAD